jgi:tetratricopeptide (TPR) repeat protein
VQAPKAPHTDPRAYSLYLQGRHFFELYSSPGYEQALAVLNEALAIDRDFAPAWATLGALYWSAANNVLIDYDEGMQKARDASANALALDESHAEALSLLGVLDVVGQRDADLGMRRIARALELEPQNHRVLTRAGILARRNGRLEDGIRYAEQALRCDPLSPNAHAALGFCLYGAGRLDEAEVMRRKVLALSPGWLSGHYYLGRILLARNDLQGALAAMQAEPGRMWRLTGLALVNHALGRTDESEAALMELGQLNPAGLYYQLAEVHAYRGEIDAAFGCLEHALETRQRIDRYGIDPLPPTCADRAGVHSCRARDWRNSPTAQPRWICGRYRCPRPVSSTYPARSRLPTLSKCRNGTILADLERLRDESTVVARSVHGDGQISVAQRHPMVLALLVSLALHARLLLSPVEWAPGQLTLPALEVTLLAIGDRDADNSNPRADVAVTTDEPDAPPPREEPEPMRAATAPLDASEPAAAFDPSDAFESLNESLAPTLPAAHGSASADRP